MSHSGEYPVRSPGTATAVDDSGTLLATQLYERPLWLNPIEAAIWGYLDGRTPIGQIVTDLADVSELSKEQSAEFVESLLLSLAGAGMVDGFGNYYGPPRDVFPPLDANDCVGLRVGLRHAVIRDVEAAGERVVRFGTDTPMLSDAVASRITSQRGSQVATGPPSPLWLRSYYLRCPAGRVPRVNRLYDGLGNIIFISRDHDEAVISLVATINALIDCVDESGRRKHHVMSPIIVGHGDCVIVHPGIRHQLMTRLWQLLAARGLKLLPSPIVEVRRNDGSLTVAPFAGTDPTKPNSVDTLRVRAVIVPDHQMESKPAQQALFERLTHMVLRWEPGQLDLIPTLMEHVVEVPEQLSAHSLAHTIESLFD